MNSKHGGKYMGLDGFDRGFDGYGFRGFGGEAVGGFDGGCGRVRMGIRGLRHNCYPFSFCQRRRMFRRQMVMNKWLFRQRSQSLTAY